MSTATDKKTRSKRGTKPGSIRTVRLRLWWAIQEASDLLDDKDKDTKLKAVSAISTASGVYAKLTETSSLQAELDDLRKELNEFKKRSGTPQTRASQVQTLAN